ncbi:uncharacterized protein BDR25DRAFT_300277 [Lindgomyces ingoldianus]|uniref:Uncharacterized protein n=1 Tax=Lindgomyces ingoldianus TaxID=673940 RepID=A0ACB6RD84_9PLEO|nr:uncharacterized protein BDR25DRAFT_300277 [Lindgomyces ingoldianus]KAF2477303.1 hypothetical protein BDR25DRAFT_300277 [Lindgomyces ingoldianus]
MNTAQFTILIRLPFVRGSFVDPPQADWSAAKDRALWKVISKTSKTSDLDWGELANRFQVPPTFILQQAAWLYERHLDHVRAQMKKVGTTNTSTTPGVGGSHATIGSVPMRRAGSGSSGAVSRTPSAMSIRHKDSPVLRGDSGAPAPSLSRTPSTNTITQSRAQFQQAQQPHIRLALQPSARVGLSDQRPSTQAARSSSIEVEKERAGLEDPGIIESTSPSSSGSESGSEDPIHRSQLFKRPPRFRAQRPREHLAPVNEPYEGDEIEPSVNVSLPFANVTSSRTNTSENAFKDVLNPPLFGRLRPTLSSTAQVSSKATGLKSGQPTKGPSASGKEKTSDASSSIASSTSDAPKSSMTNSGPLSPKHRMELARLSPKKRGLKGRREGSEGTPSMGSSFSDIDDASMSQSALEEALLSNIQHGRMSTLSQLRSRYL